MGTVTKSCNSSSRRGVAAVLGAILLAAGLLTVAGPAAQAGQAAPGNPAAIVIDQPTGTSQRVSPYPSNATTWGIDGPITDVNVDLNNLTFGIPYDIEILLVSPEGTPVVLASRTCGSSPVVRAYWTFDDEAAARLPMSGCGTGTFRPTSNYNETFPPPAPPPGPDYPWYPRELSAFRGENPNGTWRLYVHDHSPLHVDGTGHYSVDPADHGVILGGFRVIITTASMSVVVGPGPEGAGPASTYPVVEQVSGQNGVIEDVFVYLRNISHSRPDDLDVLLVAPTGRSVLLMSDACGGIPARLGTTWRFNHDDPPIPDHGICNTGPGGSGVNYSPADYGPTDLLPAPAPPGPYDTSLAALRGTNPNGTWRLFVHDDLTGHSGYLDDFSLSFDLAPPVDGDTTAPDTVIVRGPSGTTRARRATFTFRASESAASFECRIDDRAWNACTSPKTYTRLTHGRHIFRVRATDAAGNRDASAAIRSWRIRR